MESLIIVFLILLLNTELEHKIAEQQKIIEYYQLYSFISLVIFILLGYMIYYYRRQKKEKNLFRLLKSLNQFMLRLSGLSLPKSIIWIKVLI